MISSVDSYLKRLKEIQDNTVSTFTTFPEEEPRFKVNLDSRKIIIPEEFEFLGILNDTGAETIYFEMDRYFDDVDLSKYTIVIQFASEEMTLDGKYVVEGICPTTEIDIDTLKDKIIFGWTITSEVTSFVGNINFAIRIYELTTLSEDEESAVIFSYCLNTKPAMLPVETGLNVDDKTEGTYPSYFYEWNERMEELNKTASENLKTAQEVLTKAESAANSAELDKNETNDLLNQAKEISVKAPIPNLETGKWQVYNSETKEYQDTEADYQGIQGPQGIQGEPGPQGEVGPQGEKGDPGEGVPVISVDNDDYGKAITVNVDGSNYELSGPYAPIEASIRPTANGNPAVCEDSIAWSFQGLKVYGKSTQDGTPSPENPVPIISAGEGGGVEIAVTGKNLLNMSRCSAFVKSYGLTSVIDGDSVLISGIATVTMSIATFTILTTNDEFLVGRNFKFSWFTDQAITSISGLGTNNKINLAMSLQEGQSYNFAIKISVWLEKLDAWEPYTGQSLPLSTPSGLPGIPVESGGNYVDGTGQQWLCNYRDYGRGVDVGGNVNTIIFDGSSDELFYRASPGFQTEPVFIFFIPTDIWVANDIDCLSNQYVSQTVLNSGNILQNGYMWTYSEYFGKAIAVRNDAIASESEMKTFLQSNPLIFVLNGNGNLIETPIPPEELAAYRALTTYPGTTVVSTAEPVAGIEARYVADGTKIIENIDKKISDAITSAITLTQGGTL